MKSTLFPAATRRAFTLIELLTVIAIIGVLAALLLQTAGYIQEKAGISRAEAEIKALENALDSYKIDNGSFPTSSGDSSQVLVEKLMPADRDSKIYFTFPSRMLTNPKSPTAGTVQDPFGNPYHYQFPGKSDRSGTQFFDLWSQGKKNSAETNKWIKNW